MVQEEEMFLCLENGLAPQVQGKCRGGSAEDRYKVVVLELDCLLSNVSPVVFGGNKLVRHSRLGDCFFIFCRRLVVEDLVNGVMPCVSHALGSAFLCHNHGLFHPVRYGFHPCRVAINLMKCHLEFVAVAGSLRELACLICKQGLFDMIVW